MSPSQRLLRALAVMLTAGLLTTAGCGSGGGSTPAPDSTATTKTAYLVEQLRSRYLWSDRLPDSIDPATFSDEQSALDALRVPEDRFSNIVDAVTHSQFFGSGQTVAFGFMYRVESAALLLMMVQPPSPAAAAGLRRGQRISAIDGTTVAQLVSENRLDQAFGPSEAGVTRTFTIQDGSETRDVAVTKALFNFDYVLAEGVFDNNGRRIGYVSLYSFSSPGVAPWQAALDRLLADGAQDLIVDLRTNGGGLLASAATTGSALGDLAGRPMTTLTFNAANSGSNRAFQFAEDARGGRFERLIWLTGSETCSASEALILGVEAWRTATRIGSTTCGKPVGFTPSTFDDKVFNIVTFSLSNPLGAADYFDGLSPTCAVSDDGNGQFGAADETLTAAALQWLASGTCPPASSEAQRTKRLPQGRQSIARWPDPITELR